MLRTIMSAQANLLLSRRVCFAGPKSMFVGRSSTIGPALLPASCLITPGTVERFHAPPRFLTHSTFHCPEKEYKIPKLPRKQNVGNRETQKFSIHFLEKQTENTVGNIIIEGENINNLM